MFKGLFLKSIAIVILISMYNLIIGCNNMQPSGSDNNQDEEVSGNFTDEFQATEKSQTPPFEHTQGVSSKVGLDDQDVPMFTTDLSNGKLDVMSYHLDTANLSAIINLNVDYDEYISENRVLLIEYESTEDIVNGYSAGLYDSIGGLLWQFEVEIDINDSNHIWLTEKTQEDCMTIERMLTTDSYTEIYTLNGVTHEYNYPTSDVDRIMSLAEQCSQADGTLKVQSGQYSSEDEQIIQILNRFESEYITSNTLHGNPHGNLTAEIVNNDELSGWAQAEGMNLAIPTDACAICVFLAIVALVKCPYGGPANPACFIALVGVLICIIAGERL